MGCDIHMYREKSVNGEWLTADKWIEQYKESVVPWEDRFTERNYNLFGILAQVRNETPVSFKPRGMPINPCAEVENAYGGDNSDDHSASYLYLHELVELYDYLSAWEFSVTGMMNADQLHILEESIADESSNTNWNLLYPYCQGTNDPKQVDFEVLVPALFLVGDDLKKIIEMLTSVDGDNKRITFWFDN